MNVTRGLILFLGFVSVGTAGACAAAQAGMTAAESPRLPLERVETNTPAPTGRTIRVAAGGDFQDALEKAKPGDLILLTPGVEYEGPFYLPKKEGDGWITIRSSAPESVLPPGTRARPEQAAAMPALTARRQAVLIAQKGAHHFRFERVEIRPRDGDFLYNVVLLGDNTLEWEDLPHHFIFDRCYIHGDPRKGSRRGIALNSRHSAVINSHLSDFKEVGADSEAILGWGGPGPFHIVNNYLEAAGENLQFGGGQDPKIKGLVPADIEIRHNHLAKPLSWMPQHASYSGTPWLVKNLFELKNAKRVRLDGNIFEYNWLTPGYGFAIVFTVRNENGRSPWSVIEDVTFTNNIVRHSPNGVNILGHDDIHPPSEQTKRVSIRNNLFEDIDASRWGGRGTLYQVLDGTADVAIEHNTGFQSGTALLGIGAPHVRFVFRNNIAMHNEEGISGRGTGVGWASLEKYFPEAVVEKNVLIGGESLSLRYPQNNFFSESVEAVKFVGPAQGDYRLDGASAYRHIGVDMDALCRALGPLAKQEAACGRHSLAAHRP